MKRFTETDKWRDKWFRELHPASKLLFLYMIDNCNNAGFIEKDFDLWVFHIGVKEDLMQGAYEGLARGLIQEGEWIWIKNFLKHQKNVPINLENNAHKQIVELFKDKHALFKNHIPEICKKLGAKQGVISPIGKVKVNTLTLNSSLIEEIYKAYPRKENRGKAIEAIKKACKKTDGEILLEAVKEYAEVTKGCDMQFVPHPATWFNNLRWEDDREQWKLVGRDKPKESEIDLDEELKLKRGA